MSGDGVDLRVFWHPQMSTVTGPAGKPWAFTDAHLVVHNVGERALDEVRVNVSVWQEEKTLCEAQGVTEDLLGGGVLEPGARVGISVFGLLQEVDSGLASRVHLFGVKAMLNWSFRLVAQVSGCAASDALARTSVHSEFRFHWAPVQGTEEAIRLVEEPRG